ARIAWAHDDLAVVDRELARADELGYPREPLARLRGLLLARANRGAEAEPLLLQSWESSRQPDPEVAEALARPYLGGLPLAAARTALDRWTREVPGDARPYLWRAEINLRSEDNPEILIADYRAALARDPDLDRARLGLADQLRANHR